MINEHGVSMHIKEIRLNGHGILLSMNYVAFYGQLPINFKHEELLDILAANH